jgi:hypothetical protein
VHTSSTCASPTSERCRKRTSGHSSTVSSALLLLLLLLLLLVLAPLLRPRHHLRAPVVLSPVLLCLQHPAPKEFSRSSWLETLSPARQPGLALWYACRIFLSCLFLFLFFISVPYYDCYYDFIDREQTSQGFPDKYSPTLGVERHPATIHTNKGPVQFHVRLMPAAGYWRPSGPLVFQRTLTHRL